MHNELYDLLGVPRTASQEEIKAAYKQKSKEYHPDVNPNGNEMFIAIKEAYNILSDPEKRDVYDKTGKTTFENIEKHIIEFINTTIIPGVLTMQEQSFERLNMVNCMLEYVTEFKHQLIKKKENMIVIKNKLDKFLKRLKHKDNEINMLYIQFQNTLQNLNTDIDKIKFMLTVADKTRDLINEYQYNLEELNTLLEYGKGS